MIEMEDFDGEESPFERPGFMSKFMGAVTSEEFKDMAKVWGKGAATATVLTLVSYTVKFLGGEIVTRGNKEVN